MLQGVSVYYHHLQTHETVLPVYKTWICSDSDVPDVFKGINTSVGSSVSAGKNEKHKVWTMMQNQHAKLSWTKLS